MRLNLRSPYSALIRFRLVFLLLPAMLASACSPSRPLVTDAPVTTSSDTVAPGLRVVSFNVRYNNPDDGIDAWPNRRDWVANLMTYHDADLYGLQEVLQDQLDDLLERLPGYAFVGVGRTDGWREGEYAPILYRRDRFEVLDQGTFWLSETPADTGSVGWDAALPRIVTWMSVRDTSGVEFFHFNTHFDHRGERARKESARLVASEISRRAGRHPVVLTGDFNVPDTSDAYAILTEFDRRPADRSGDALQDARTAAPMVAGPERTSGGFDLNLRPGRPIDYIFVKNGIRPTFFATLVDTRSGRFPSDHRPVLADVVLPALP